MIDMIDESVREVNALVFTPTLEKKISTKEEVDVNE